MLLLIILPPLVFHADFICFYHSIYLGVVPTGRTYGYYHDVYTVKTSPSRYHARLGNMRTTTTTTTNIYGPIIVSAAVARRTLFIIAPY